MATSTQYLIPSVSTDHPGHTSPIDECRHTDIKYEEVRKDFRFWDLVECANPGEPWFDMVVGEVADRLSLIPEFVEFVVIDQLSE